MNTYIYIHLYNNIILLYYIMVMTLQYFNLSNVLLLLCALC